MDSSTLLDYALFQLTPTRTRCDLIIFNERKTEKLASGLFEPFVTHLKFAKDQISKGGYSIKLCPPTNNAPWFTKATFERFVRFVSTPAVLERFVSLENEILQIESSVQANELLNTDAAGQQEDGNGSVNSSNTRMSIDSCKIRSELERSDDSVPEENSKAQLKRLLETRKKLLLKEQAMAYARGLVAGFEMDNIDDLISFADAFGAVRLREACNNFRELCKKKRGDGLWMEELAAMEAYPPPELSFLGTSGIVLTNEFSTPNQNISTSELTTHASADSQKDDNLAKLDQTQSTTAAVQVPVPWPNQMPQYVYNFPGPIQHLPPYQRYPFPTMQPIPPQYPMNVQWPPRKKESGPAKKEKSWNREGTEYSEEEGKTESSDSEVGTDSDSCIKQDIKLSSSDASNRKKHRKKSSKTVVIRNINYITPERRNKDKDGDSDEYSSDDNDFVDEDSIKQKVNDAIESLGKLRKSTKGSNEKKSSKKGSHIANGSIGATSEDFDDDSVSNTSKGGKTNENWDAFQNILMRDEENVNGTDEVHPVDIQDDHFTVYEDKNSLAINPAIDMELQKAPKQRMTTDDSFVVNQREEGSEDRFELEHLENAENGRPIIKRNDTADEDLVISRRLEESGSGFIGILSSLANESSTMKPGKGEDWFVIDTSSKAENHDATNGQTILNDDCMLSSEGHCFNVENSKKDVLIDDSFMLHSRPAIDDADDSQWRTDISMAADLTLSTQLENCNIPDNHEVQDVYEPNDLCMVLERESGFESARESWNTDIDIRFIETERRSSSVDTGDNADKTLPSNGDSSVIKKNETTGRKGPVKEVRSKPLHGTTGKSKTEMIPKSKKSSFRSRPTVQKSKLEKEEELRKKMEELSIQRQKRIAERTAAAGISPAASKRVSSENKTVKSSMKSDKNKTHTTISSVKIRAT